MSDWGGEPVPDVRLSPADHYDQAMRVIQKAHTTEDPDAVMIAWLEVLGQGVLGLLRSRMEQR